MVYDEMSDASKQIDKGVLQSGKQINKMSVWISHVGSPPPKP